MISAVDTNFIFEQNSETVTAENVWSRLYENAIEILAKAGDDHTFESASCEQTATIIKNIVRFSEQTVFIYVHEFDPEVSDRIPGLLDVFKNYLEKEGTELWIAVEKKASTAEELVDEIGIFKLARAYNGRFKVKLASNAFKESLKQIKDELKIAQDFYFAVGDKKAFQIMTIAGEYKGYGSFNNKNVAEKLHSSFCEHFLPCEEYFTKMVLREVFESAAS